MKRHLAPVVLLLLALGTGCGGAEAPSQANRASPTPQVSTPSSSATAPLTNADLAACTAYLRVQEAADELLKEVTTDSDPTTGTRLVQLADELAADAASATSDRLAGPLAETVPALKALGTEIAAGHHTEAELTPAAKTLWHATELVVSACKNADPANNYVMIAPFALDL